MKRLGDAAAYWGWPATAIVLLAVVLAAPRACGGGSTPAQTDAAGVAAVTGAPLHLPDIGNGGCWQDACETVILCTDVLELHIDPNVTGRGGAHGWAATVICGAMPRVGRP